MIQQILSSVALVILGGLITAVWTKYRNRITTLRYYVTHNFFGSSVENPHYGSVEVKHQDTKVENLYVSHVQLTNDSARDLTNLELNIVCDPDSLLLTSRGVLEGSLNDLELTEDFLDTYFDEQGNVLPGYSQRRDFSVPVLNRGEQVSIGFLTTNPKGVQPTLTVACDHPGVRLKFAVAKPLIFGEPQQESGLLGSAIVLLACWPIIVFVAPTWLAVLGAAFLGVVAMVVGVLARKLGKGVARLFR